MQQTITWIATLLAIFGALNAAVAQDNPQRIEVKKVATESRVFSSTDKDSPCVQFTVSISPTDKEDTVSVEFETKIAEGWHISPVIIGEAEFGQPTTLKVESKDLTAIDKQFVPSVAPTTEKMGDDEQRYHVGQFKWTRKYKSTANFGEVAATASVRFQVCDDNKCFPPKTISFLLEPEQGPAVSKTKSEAVKLTHAKIGEPIELVLEECELERRQVKMGDVSVLSLLLSSGLKNDKLDLKGQLTVGSESFDFYLPNSDEYSLKNTGTGKTRFENTATYMSIDHNRDGQLVDSEAIAMNGPIRFADSMFRVSHIDRESKKITFQQVDAPIEGAIVGRKCPPFSYTTTEGDTITDKSILGKVTVLDIWAVT